MRLNSSKNWVAVEPLECRRLMAFGNTDLTFGDDGRAVTLMSGGAPPQVQDLCVSGGGIIAGGDHGLVRYTASGAIDQTFGQGGEIAYSGVSFRAQAVDAGGNVYALLAGPSGTVVVKYDVHGQPVQSFGMGGIALVATGSTYSAKALAMQSDGKILVAGTRSDPNNSAARVYRLKGDGRPDDGFGDHGVVEIQFGQPGGQTPNVIDRVAGIAALGGGQILVGGGAITLTPMGTSTGDDPPDPQIFGDASFASARLNGDGQLDGNYGDAGIARVVYSTGDELADHIGEFGVGGVLPAGFAAAPDGSALLAANADTLAVAEFTPAGQLRFNVHADDGFPLEQPTDSAFLADGRAVILGRPDEDNARGLVMTWVATDGALASPVFTDDLISATPDLQSTSSGALAIAPDGRLLVGGASAQNDGYEIVKFSAGKISDPAPGVFPNALYNRIMKDSAGGLHLAYFDTVQHVLKYAYRAPNGLWSDPVTVDTSSDCGWNLSLAINSLNQPVIAYFDGADTSLKLAYSADAGKTWPIQTIDEKGNVGQYPSLALDSANRPRVSYYRKSSADLRYAFHKRGGWRIQTIEAEGDVGRSSALALNPRTGLSSVAYVDNTTRRVKCATQNKFGSWSIATATRIKGSADYLSMGFSYYFGPIVSFYDTKFKDLKVAYFTDGWQWRVLGDENAQGLWTSLAVPDFYGAPSVYAWDRAANKVVLFDGSTDDEPRATDVVTGGGNYLSVAYDGKTADIAYFDSAMNALRVRAATAPGNS